jgi:hypothetical protein
MVDRFMAGELGAGNAVGRGFIGHQPGLTAQVGADDGLEVGDANAVNLEAAGRTAAFNRCPWEGLGRPLAWLREFDGSGTTLICK